jgi:hypothetical protein
VRGKVHQVTKACLCYIVCTHMHQTSMRLWVGFSVPWYIYHDIYTYHCDRCTCPNSQKVRNRRPKSFFKKSLN